MFFTTTQQLREGSEYLYMQAGQNHSSKTEILSSSFIFCTNTSFLPTSHAARRWSPPLPHMQQGTGPLPYLSCSKALVPSSTSHVQQCAGPLPYLSCSNVLVPSPNSHAARRWSPPLPHMQQGAGPLLYLSCSNVLVPSSTSHAARRWSPPYFTCRNALVPSPTSHEC